MIVSFVVPTVGVLMVSTLLPTSTVGVRMVVVSVFTSTSGVFTWYSPSPVFLQAPSVAVRASVAISAGLRIVGLR